MNIRAKIYGGAQAAEGEILKAKLPRGAQADALHSVEVPREEVRRSNNRHEDRHRLSDEQATVIHGGRSYQVQLVNLSGGGAMVTGPFEPMLWDRVDLHLGEHGQVECVVRWLRGGRIGLEFAHETRLDCSDDQRAAVLRDVIIRSFPDLDLEQDESGALESARRQSTENHRAEARHPLIWSGLLHHDYQTTQVRIRNISSSGAMIEAPCEVRVGAEPLLELNDAASISATVAWAVGDQVGLRFHTPLDMSLLSHSRPEVTPTTWVCPAYLSQPQLPDSPWDPRWNRLSVGELKEELEGFLKR